jgi:hypothetical protein
LLEIEFAIKTGSHTSQAALSTNSEKTGTLTQATDPIPLHQVVFRDIAIGVTHYLLKSPLLDGESRLMYTSAE